MGICETAERARVFVWFLSMQWDFVDEYAVGRRRLMLSMQCEACGDVMAKEDREMHVKVVTSPDL